MVPAPILGERQKMSHPEKTSIYDQLRTQIIELTKTNDNLRSEIRELRKELVEEVRLKYKAYEKLSKLS